MIRVDFSVEGHDSFAGENCTKKPAGWRLVHKFGEVDGNRGSYWRY